MEGIGGEGWRFCSLVVRRSIIVRSLKVWRRRVRSEGVAASGVRGVRMGMDGVRLFDLERDVVAT